MSCIRFSTPVQIKQLREAAPSMLTREEAASLHPAQAVTDSKIRRLRLLAQHSNPKIRESVASSYNAPADVLAALWPATRTRACAPVSRIMSMPPLTCSAFCARTSPRLCESRSQ